MVRISKILFSLLFGLFIVGLPWFVRQHKYNFETQPLIGDPVDSHLGIPVYYNGKNFSKSYGDHFSSDGYYYGQKWQCVEYVKRFYCQALSHKMPNVWGHARDFYDPTTNHAKMNDQRGLVQYQNGGNVKPAVNDLIVFTAPRYGHVAIITSVNNKSIEIIQQNVFGKTRQRLKLIKRNNNYYVICSMQAAGWLRLKTE
ncbi:CHAP domain-containing protein [candidate division KSB1 bacterium]|nr:CHAP domain-containing protein [candidate division KSB1 bacterium]